MASGWSAPPFITAAVFFSLVFLALLYSSAWLWGRRYFIATLAAWTFCVACIAAESALGSSTSGIDSGVEAIAIGIAGPMLYLTFFYFVSIKYITRTELMDASYQQPDAFKYFLERKREVTSFDRFVLRLPYLLAFGMLTLLGLGVLHYAIGRSSLSWNEVAALAYFLALLTASAATYFLLSRLPPSLKRTWYPRASSAVVVGFGAGALVAIPSLWTLVVVAPVLGLMAYHYYTKIRVCLACGAVAYPDIRGLRATAAGRCPRCEAGLGAA